MVSYVKSAVGDIGRAISQLDGLSRGNIVSCYAKRRDAINSIYAAKW